MRPSLVISFLFIAVFAFSQTDTLIRTAKQAIAIAEPILFKTYGKRHIKKERPYHLKLKEGLWYITGTLKYELGGVFEMVIDSKDGKVVGLTHGK